LGSALNFVEFEFGMLHYDKILINWGDPLLGGNFIVVGRAAGQSCSATRMFGSCSVFARGPKNITEKLDRTGRSQNLADAR